MTGRHHDNESVESSAPADTYVEKFAALATRCRDEGIPDEVARLVREHVVDTLGICIAAQSLATSKEALEHACETGGPEHAHLIGVGVRVPPAQAAFGNGVLAHSLDYDDTHLPSVLHPSASVVPAGLAVAEAEGVSGREVVAAVAAGLEISVRLGIAGYDAQARTSSFFSRGQHATSICGMVGAAATAALIMGMNDAEVAHSMAIAASFASGIIEGNRMGGTVKRTHCGWAAHGGVNAAQLAKRGFTGPRTVFEGRFGFYQAFLDGRYDPDQLDGDLGDRWEVLRIFLKPYPANHFTHAGIDAALRLREQGVRAEEIASMTLGVAAPVLQTIGDPIDVKRRPQNGYEAQFSGPYAVAAALLGGSGLGLGLDDFTEHLARDPVRHDLMDRITVVSDARCDEIFPHQFPAILHVRLRDGEEREEAVLSNRGGPDWPLTEAEIRYKLRDNVAPWVAEDAAAKIGSILERADALDDVAAVMQATCRAEVDAGCR